MKKYNLISIGITLIFFVACNVKGSETEEEETYNPYDTSEEMKEFDSAGDTIYTMDSVAKSFKLHELNSQVIK